MKRGLGMFVWALPLLAVIVSRAIVSFSHPWALGLDGYSYALQIEHLLSGRGLLYQDVSLAYPLLAGLGILAGGDAVLATKIGVLISSLGGTALFLLALRRLGAKDLPMLAAALAYAISPLRTYLDTEFLKQSWGMLAWAGLLAALAALDGSMKGNAGAVDNRFRRPIPVARGRPGMSALRPFIASVLWLLAACSFHLLSGSLAMGTVFLYAFMRSGLKGRLVAFAGALAIIGAFLWASLSGAFPSLTLERLGRFSFGAPQAKIASVLSQRTPWWEKAEFFLLPLSAPVLIAGAFVRDRKGSPRRALLLALGVVAACLAFPFLDWSFEGAAFRFLLASTLPAAFAAWLILESLPSLAAGRPRPRNLAMALQAMVAVAFLVLLVPSARAFLRPGRFPDYAALDGPFGRLADMVPRDAGLVAGRGIAAFARWKSGMRTTIFAPEASDAINWYRVAHGMRARAFEPYRRQGEAAARDIAPGWVLLPETLWRRFDAAQGPDASYRRSPANPSYARPRWDRSIGIQNAGQNG